MKSHGWWKSAPASGVLIFTLFDVIIMILLRFEITNDWVSSWWTMVHSPIHRYLDPLFFPTVTTHPLSISDVRMFMYELASVAQFTILGFFSGFFIKLWQGPSRLSLIRDITVLVAALIIFSCARPSLEPGLAFQYITTHANLSFVGDDIEFKLKSAMVLADGENWAVNNWKKKSPRDGWERPLVFKNPITGSPQQFLLYSLGPNGIDENGSGDDIAYDGK